MMQPVFDTVIIGAGPAGLTAALYAGRFQLSTIVLEKMSIGGQIVLSEAIENYPGFPGGIPTQGLIEKMKLQVQRLGVEFETEEVLEISSLKKDAVSLYNLKTREKNYITKTVILACGAQFKKLDVLGEDKFIGRGISYCATCDGPLYKNKKVIVVGAGDRALEEAILLSKYASSVILIHRRQGFRASGILVKKAKGIAKIDFVLDTVIEEICGQSRVEYVKLKNLITNTNSQLQCEGVFIFVGIRPNTEFIRKQLHSDEFGFIITDQGGRTSKEGIFACGDCCKKNLYQVINACGEAATAVDSAQRYLLEKG